MSRIFGVRLSDQVATAIAEEALRRGMKPTTAARELLLEALSGATGRAVDARLSAIEATLERLERELPEALALAVAQAAAASMDGGEHPPALNEVRQSGSLAAWVKAS